MSEFGDMNAFHNEMQNADIEDMRNCIKRIKSFENEDIALRTLIELQRDCAKYLFECAQFDIDHFNEETRLTQFDYIGDHVDYNPAASFILNEITNALCDDTDMRKPIELIESLFFGGENDEFAMAYSVIDIGTSMQAYYEFDWDM